MTELSPIPKELQELAERYYGLLEDQLYDPQPEVDGYGREKQQQAVTNLLRDLARDAANLLADHDRRDENQKELKNRNGYPAVKPGPLSCLFEKKQDCRKDDPTD